MANTSYTELLLNDLISSHSFPELLSSLLPHRNLRQVDIRIAIPIAVITTIVINLVAIALLVILLIKIGKEGVKAYECAHGLTKEFIKLLLSMDRYSNKFMSILFHVMHTATELLFKQTQQHMAFVQLVYFLRDIIMDRMKDGALGVDSDHDHDHDKSKFFNGTESSLFGNFDDTPRKLGVIYDDDSS